MIARLLQLFCQYEDDRGYTFLSPEALSPEKRTLNYGLNIQSLHRSRSRVLIRILKVSMVISMSFGW